MTQKEILQAANDYVGHPFDIEEDVNISNERWAFVNGAEWTLKQAKHFEATVCKVGNTYLKEMNKDDIALALQDYNDGDKVMVLIYKI